MSNTVEKIVMTVAFIVICAGILVFLIKPSFFYSSYPISYCSCTEADAGNILASLSCYFSEPDNKSCYSLESLINDDICGFLIDNKADLKQVGSMESAYWIVTVTDSAISSVESLS